MARRSDWYLQLMFNFGGYNGVAMEADYKARA